MPDDLSAVNGVSRLFYATSYGKQMLHGERHWPCDRRSSLDALNLPSSALGESKSRGKFNLRHAQRLARALELARGHGLANPPKTNAAIRDLRPHFSASSVHTAG